MRAAAQSWRTTPGTITKSRVEVTGGDHTSTMPGIYYEYQVGAVTYTGDQVKAGDKFYPHYTSRQCYDLVDKYPVGSEVQVFYDPEAPENAALER